MNELEAAFEREMLAVYHDAKRAGYNATYFLRMVQQMGGLAAAHKLLETEEFHQGFTRLWEIGRLDLSVEARVLRPQYRTLFSDEELARARRRLAELGFKALWEEGEMDQ